MMILTLQYIKVCADENTVKLILFSCLLLIPLSALVR